MSGEVDQNASSSAANLRADSAQAHEYWRANLRIMALLLTFWFAIPFGLGIVFVEPLNAFHLGGFPLGFWFAQQGSTYSFVILVLIYAFWMRRLDRQFGVQ